MAETPTNTTSEIQALSEVLREHTESIKAQAARTEELVAGVQRDADLREVKVQRLEEQALALQDQTERLRKFGKAILMAVVVSIVGILLMVFLLFKFNQDSQNRSKTASDQRAQQLQLSQKAQANLQKAADDTQAKQVATGKCIVMANGNVSVYEACVAKNEPSK